MTVMEAARLLGSAIQEDPRFADYRDASALATIFRRFRPSSTKKPSKRTPTKNS